MKLVCYYAIPRGSNTDNTTKSLPVEEIDPFLCTHIVVAFARIRENLIVPEVESDTEIYEKVTSLKNQNPNLKVLLSLGGGASDGGFPSLVRDPESVKMFASSAREFLIKYSFDGLDLDWEFPAWPVLKKHKREKHLFTELVRHLYENFKLMPQLLLSAAVAGPKSIIDRSYEVNLLVKYIDFVCLMGYDYRIYWPYLPFTGHNAPLAKHRGDKFYFATMNIEWSALYWVKKGMPKEKIIIGIPTYGRSWRLLRASWNDVGSPAIGQGILNGSLSYPESKSFLESGGVSHFDEECKVPYAVNKKDWISYEDCRSIEEKVRWTMDNDFAGIMTWNLNCDDWSGIYSQRKFELHNTIKALLFGESGT